MILIDASSGYHNLELDKKNIFNYICMSIWQVQIHQTIGVPAGDMFQ